MLSRTAESLYWLARYAERADATGRLLMMGRRLAMLPEGVSGDDWRSVLRVAGSEGFVEPHHEVTESDAVAVLLLDPDNPSSIRATLDAARANGPRAQHRRDSLAVALVHLAPVGFDVDSIHWCAARPAESGFKLGRL